MKRVMVSYTVKDGRADENAALIQKVFQELKETRPEGIRYASMRLPDGVFVHLAEIDTADGSNPLAATAAFKAFQAELKDRCDVPPAAKDIEIVGDYGLL